MTPDTSTRARGTTDSTTGLGNRHRLMADLDAAIADGTPHVLVVFDLAGFEHYCDTFGSVARDALLRRLGHNLSRAAGEAGCAYRLRSDEFWVLVSAPAPHGGPIVESAAAALCEHGRGFTLASTFGAVVVPAEARTAKQAVEVADERLAKQRSARPGAPQMDAAEVLLQAFRDSDPHWDDVRREASGLMRAVGTRLGLSDEQLDELVRAAEVSDIGKMALPDAILVKAGPLTEEEWAFVRRHTLIGEEIVAASPDLAPLAKLVRSSHEHFDGAGYPDGLAGEAIPLASRIMFACDAYGTMTTRRAHSRARTREDAVTELEGRAGKQFDPRVVQALCEVVAGEAAIEPEPALAVRRA